MAAADAPYLLTREEAVARYGIPMRTLVRVYQCNKDFPVVRVGRSMRIHREKADEWFTERIRTEIDTK